MKLFNHFFLLLFHVFSSTYVAARRPLFFFVSFFIECVTICSRYRYQFVLYLYLSFDVYAPDSLIMQAMNHAFYIFLSSFFFLFFLLSLSLSGVREMPTLSDALFLGLCSSMTHIVADALVEPRILVRMSARFFTFSSDSLPSCKHTRCNSCVCGCRNIIPAFCRKKV